MSTSTVHPFLQYLRDVTRTAARHLLPFVWRLESERLIEETAFVKFHEGHNWPHWDRTPSEPTGPHGAA